MHPSAPESGGWRTLLSRPVEELSRWQRAVRYAIDLARHCAEELRHDKAGQMAAALTYHTLFSMLPMIAMGFVALNAFVGEEQRAEIKESVVNWTVNVLSAPPGDSPLQVISPKPIEPDSLAALPPDPQRSEFLTVRENLNARFQDILDRLDQVDFGRVGIVGVLIFIWGATGLLGTVERSFNTIYGQESGRSWYVSLPLYYTMITLGPIVILAGQFLQARILNWLQLDPWSSWLATTLTLVTPLLATWVVILFMYLLLTTASVGKRSALVGSFVAALLLVLVRKLFGIYVSTTVITSLYGALALLPIFLLLLWIMWLLVLFGLELAYSLDAMRGRRFKRDQYKVQDNLLVDGLWLLPLSARIAAAFENGERCTVPGLSQDMRLPPILVTRMLNALQRGGIVVEVADREGKGITLARPAEAISVGDVLVAAQNTHPVRPEWASESPAWRWVDRLRDADLETTRKLMLSQLIPGPDTA